MGHQKYIFLFNNLSSLLKFRNNSDVKIVIFYAPKCINTVFHVIFLKGGTDSWIMLLFPSNETHPQARVFLFLFVLNWFYVWDLWSLMLNFSVLLKVFKISVNGLAFSGRHNLLYYGDSSAFWSLLHIEFSFNIIFFFHYGTNKLYYIWEPANYI